MISTKCITKILTSKELAFILQGALLVIRCENFACFLSEELVEAVLAVGDQLLSEVALFDGLHGSFLMSSEVKLEFYQGLTEIAVEDAVGLLSLCLGVDSLNYFEKLILDLLCHRKGVNFLVVSSFELVLQAAKNVFPQLGKLLLEVVGQNLVND